MVASTLVHIEIALHTAHTKDRRKKTKELQGTLKATLPNMASTPTQLLLRRLLKSGGPSTVHGRSAMRLEPPSVNDRIEEMNTQLRALEVQLGHKGQDPKAAVQDLEYHKMYRDLKDITRGG
ncbi:hypothetical protein BHE90_000652 [Fusarium euwallaceae]|uniref:Uncharacterized protein n=1 Tax=Fusarium euwallaceae TaxID=1147111 RepID=A0A430MAD1_9HYPO|nr:hypothetical protein BHE90_000652 [Fusarium euwallaceae]